MFLPYVSRIILCVCALVALATTPVRAQELQPLPELAKGFDLADYAASTDTVKKEFPEIPNLAFEIALPKTWLERIALGEGYGEIARFDGPAFGDVRPYFSFKRMTIPRENSARLELISYLLKQGYVLRSLKEIDERNVEAVYVVIDQSGDSFVVRTVMRIMGPDMLLAEYAVPVQAWERQRDEQTFAIQSFKFLNDSDEPIEKRIDRAYFSALRFHYPASWVFEGEDAREDNRVGVRLAVTGANGLETGRMRLTVVSPRSLKDDADKRGFGVDVPALLKDVRKTYEERGFELSPSIESSQPKLNLPATFSAMDVYNLRRRVTEYETDKRQPISHELWVAVFRGPPPYPKTYILELFTPSRSQDLYLWAVNKRAMEIVLESIQ